MVKQATMKLQMDKKKSMAKAASGGYGSMGETEKLLGKEEGKVPTGDGAPPKLTLQKTRTVSKLHSEGLTSELAAELLKKFGRNELPEKKKAKWVIFVEQLTGPMPIMYVRSCVVCFFLLPNPLYSPLITPPPPPPPQNRIWIAIVIECAIKSWYVARLSHPPTHLPNLSPTTTTTTHPPTHLSFLSLTTHPPTLPPQTGPTWPSSSPSN